MGTGGEYMETCSLSWTQSQSKFHLKKNGEIDFYFWLGYKIQKNFDPVETLEKFQVKINLLIIGAAAE